MTAARSTQKEIPFRPKHSPRTRRLAALEGAGSPLPRELCRLQMPLPDRKGIGRRRVQAEKARLLSRREHGPPAEAGYRPFRPSISAAPQEQWKPHRRPRIPGEAVPARQERRAVHLYRRLLLLNGIVLCRPSREWRSPRSPLEYRDREALPPFVPARQEAENV